MRGSRKLCQRRSNFDFDFFLVDEGREDQNTTIDGPSSARSFKWRFAGGPIMAQN